MKIHRFLTFTGTAGLAAVLLATASSHGQILFADSFNRPDNTDLNASTDGKSGTLGALTWTTVLAPASSVVDILSNQLRINSGDSSGNNGGLAYISDHNFVDAEIKTAGTFTVTMDVTQQSSGGDGRYVGFRIGEALADLTGETNAGVSGNAADVQVYLDMVGGTRGIRIFEAGTSLGYVYSNATQGPGLLSATFTFGDMNAGTTLNYEVFLDGISRYAGSTTWSGTDENYISLQSNSTNNTLINNFRVEVPTVDVTPPVLDTTDPVDDATDVPVTNNLVASFDEAIVLGATGSVTIRNLTHSADTVISLPGPDPDGTLSVSGNDLIIDPAADLVAGEDYVIEISSDLIEDTSGNVYPGLLETDAPNWSFTADGNAPLLAATNPADDATNVTTTANLVATFNETVVLGTTGTVAIRNLTTPGQVEIDLPGPDPDGTLSVTGTDLVIDPAAGLVAGDDYVIEITGDVVADISGNLFGGLLETDDPNWSFTTDNTPPANGSFGPMSGSTDFSIRDILSLTLDEDALVGTGNITIHLASDDSVVETIDVTSGLVTIDGSTISIDPSVDLSNATAYYVNIEAGAFTDLSGNAYPGILDTTTWAFTTAALDPNLLFADKFTRPDNGDLNATSAGKSGMLGALTWSTVVAPATSVVDILSNQLRINSGDSDGNNGGVAYISDHNFAGLTDFSVTMDITAKSSGGDGRYVGFRIGQSLADLTGETNAGVSGNAADVQVYLDTVGATRGIRIFEAGTSLGYVYSNATQGPGVLSANFTFADMNAGTTLNYEVFLDGISRYVGSTTWSGTDENYISLQSNSTSNTLIDSFEVRGQAVVMEKLTLEISSSNGLLDFAWNSMPGMQYDLVSSTDPESEPDPSLWAPYNDGSITYENIVDNSLTGVALVDPTRFFAIIEEPMPPLLSEDFDSDDGGFTVIDNSAGGAGSDWAYGMPNSDGGLGGGAVTTDNSGSGSCWGTDIGNPGTYAFGTDTSLISPVIDLAGLSSATLSFAQAVDILSPDALTVNIIEADTSGGVVVVSGGAAIYTEEDSDALSAVWEEVSGIDLSAGLGQQVRLEFRFVGDGDGSFIGAYLDDIVVTGN